jgi:CRP-like cAMP-binding protein
MSDISDTVAKIRHLSLFQEFGESELEGLASLIDCACYSDGQLIVKQDEPGESMYVIVTGTVKVVHRADAREIELATLHEGDFFGEIALVDEGPRSADVVAIGDARMLSISQATIRALAGVYPSAAFKLLVAVGRVLVSRLRHGNKKYIDSLLA